MNDKTTTYLIAEAIISKSGAYPIGNALAELWDEVVSHDTWGTASLAWVYEIRQAEILGYGQSLFAAVQRRIRKRLNEAKR